MILIRNTSDWNCTPLHYNVMPGFPRKPHALVNAHTHTFGFMQPLKVETHSGRKRRELPCDKGSRPTWVHGAN